MQLNAGQIISGVAHTGLIAFAIFGGAFQSEPLPFEVTEVTAISAEEYAALIAEPSPDAVANIDTPEPPQEGQAPQLSTEADTPPEQDQPEVAEASEPDPVPDVTNPTPEAEVSDEPPVLQPPEEDVAVLVPETSERPQARPAPRVAPEPVAQPEPDVEIADVDQQASEPSDQAEETLPEQEETAREEASDRIVTEAEQLAAAAPSRSIRPQTRPTRPTTAAQPEAEQDPTPDNSAVDNALAEALGNDSAARDVPQGPPLTAGEKDGLRVAVQQCWNVGSLSSDALATTVVVAVSMTEDAKPITGSIKMLSSQGGSDAAARQAFEAARRAIIRCGARGYNLPVEKFATWRDIEMTFNPEKMRIK